MAYSGIFRTGNIFSQLQAHYSGITQQQFMHILNLIRQIQVCLELWLIMSCFTHMHAYSPPLNMSQGASDVLWTSEWMSIWCPSVHRKYGTSGGRPNSVHYGRPLDIPIGRPTDAHMRPIQRRHVCKFISWTISSLIYFEVLRTKNFKYFFWIWKRGFWKGTKGCREKRGKRPINSSTAF